MTIDRTPRPAGRKPMLVRLGAKGARVLWCACGRSGTQPFCDGSHKGTDFAPVPYVVAADGEEKLFCLCKRTNSPPFCDGSHNALDAGYALAGADEIARTAGAREAAFDADGVAWLDGGAYVLRLGEPRTGSGGWVVAPTAGARLGARHLAQHVLAADAARPQPISYPDAPAVLFVSSGAGAVEIAGRRFAFGDECAIALRPREAARFRLTRPLVMTATTAAPAARPEIGAAGGAFDAAFPERVRPVDAAQRHAMGDRFYQVLADAASGAGDVTQFIGEIPRSRAALHRHLYEEAIYVLSGAGVAWTETARAAIQAGDVVFLPMRVAHALEASAAAGLRLAGAFTPSGSPAINY
jgi:CDGSH-type Zn-finger protein/quercetin dioxygenase-like cupin family protein